MRNEDGYDDDVCRLSLPTTSLGWPHQLLKLIGVGPQEAAVEAEKVYQMEYTSLGQQQRNQVYCHYDHDFFLIMIMMIMVIIRLTKLEMMI